MTQTQHYGMDICQLCKFWLNCRSILKHFLYNSWNCHIRKVWLNHEVWSNSFKNSLFRWKTKVELWLRHRTLIKTLIKLKGTAKLIVQGERVCLKDSKCILFEILENQTWKGHTSSCRPSQPNRQIGRARPAGACTALPCLIF